MSEKPWREQGWDEWCELWDCAIPNDRVDFARFREATDEKRAELDAGWQISVKATEKAIDALCARVWREAQRITWQAWQKQHDENGCERAEAERARADRLAAALPDALQARVAEWHDRNFGDAPQLARALIICEEVGELAHVVLKQTQNIRPETATDAHLRDAMGDIVIALCALAASRGWSLWNCVTETAEVVLARDWNADRAVPCRAGG